MERSISKYNEKNGRLDDCHRFPPHACRFTTTGNDQLRVLRTPIAHTVTHTYTKWVVSGAPMKRAGTIGYLERSLCRRLVRLARILWGGENKRIGRSNGCSIEGGSRRFPFIAKGLLRSSENCLPREPRSRVSKFPRVSLLFIARSCRADVSVIRERGKKWQKCRKESMVISK